MRVVAQAEIELTDWMFEVSIWSKVLKVKEKSPIALKVSIKEQFILNGSEFIRPLSHPFARLNSTVICNLGRR
jgi:hypothetical protein